MNRIPVRGVGFAAVAVAAASLAWGAPVSAAPATPTEHVSTTLSSAVLVTAYDARTDGSAAELDVLRSAHLQSAYGGAAARAQRLHLLHLARLQHLRAQSAGQPSRSAVRAPAAVAVVPGSVRALGETLAAQHGWVGPQFSCLDYVWTHESHWRVSASNSGSGAYGIPQAQPGSKMATAGPDWKISAATQIAWGLAYIDRTYGSPCAAWAFWQDHHWY
jgi:hypothetical protein